ncbi:cytochrome P450 [Saccharomonospora xinjiangensis]|uniref:Cytochrome P450 n=1 Tax=Saccharomonospora xinjiangensis XJ-54 TaxID=882086 RepID=I0V8F6_9PSEU|nr:cytochrome P450 [Saccharomonospora xinjiangensis]EID56409.1 cytochrome P450 [Saccharomonospora xinjiangensis XJ-54]
MKPAAGRRPQPGRGGGAGLPAGPALPAVVQTALWAAAPVWFGRTCLRRYGPLFTARILGFGPVVYACSPETIRRILLDDAAAFDAASANESIRFVVGEHSLLMSGGAEHTRRRKLLMRPLHGRNVADYVDVMVSIVEREMRSWRPGSTVRLLDCFQRVTLEVMIRAVFGITDSARLDRLRVLVPKLLALNPLIILLPALRKPFGGIGPWARFQRLLREVDDIIHAEIRQRRQRLAAEPDLRGSDVLTLLLTTSSSGTPLSDTELRDHMVTLLAVGQETTATQLAWFFERVLRSGSALRRVQAAVDEGDTRVLDAAIHEAIRARPTTLDVGRITVGRWEAEGHSFPAGTLFAVSLGLLHLSPDLHPVPESYSIDRFHPVEPPSTHFLPFGGGNHRCLGASLAMVEMRTVITTILRNARLRPRRAAPERVKPKGPMLVPGHGAEVVVDANHLPAYAASATVSEETT